MSDEALEIGLTLAQKEAMREAMARALEPLRADPPILLPDWADRHFYLSPESSGAQGRWTTLHYQRGILLLFGNDDVKVVDVMKAARMGYTKCLLIFLAFNALHRRRSGVLYQPTDSDALAFMKTEVEPMIRDVPALTAGLVGGDKQSKTNTTEEKHWPGCVLHVRGGKSPRAYRGLTKHWVLYDELDGFDSDIGGEGSPVSLGDNRITQSYAPKSIRGTTPTVAGASHIEDCIRQADETFTYHPRCFHCDELVPFAWRHLVWQERDPATAQGACEKCGGLWEFSDHYRLMEAGRWMSEGGLVVEHDGTFSRNGERAPAPRHAAIKMWAGISPFITWADLVDEHLKAGRNPLLLKTHTNTRKGELWEEKGESIRHEELALRAEHYETDLPADVCYVTAGIDVQADRFEIQYSGWAPEEVHYSLAYERIFGDLSRGEIWDLIFKATQRRFVGADGRQLDTGLVVIDSGYLADEVYRFCRRDVHRLIPGKGQPNGPIIAFPRQRNKVHRVYLTMIGTDQAKNLIYARLQSEEPRMYRWPRDASHDAGYFRQLTAEERRRTYERGREVFKWHLPNGRRNEVLDTNVYSLAAVRIAQQYMGVKLEPPAPERAPEPPSGGQGWVRTGGGSWL